MIRRWLDVARSARTVYRLRRGKPVLKVLEMPAGLRELLDEEGQR